jgi:four helix bundle protein
MGINRFEDINAWQEARKLTSMAYSLTSQGKLQRDYGLKDQIQRASVSVMANIAEGFGSRRNGEFNQFLSYSRRSAIEVQSLLYALLDAG